MPGFFFRSPFHFHFAVLYLIHTNLVGISETRWFLLNVTTKGRYALRVMLDLAQHRDEGFISLKTVAERQDISMKYLESIVCALKKAGLVESTRGKEGGYTLPRRAEEYSVGEILRCLEDSLAPVACIKDGSVDCAHARECMTLPMWMELDEITNAYLDRVTLQDLLSGEKWRS